MPKKVLIIDDNDTARSVMADCLHDEGYVIGKAVSASEGLHMCEKVDFDLVITDIMLPDRDGTSLIVELRRRFPGLPIIAVSGAPSTAFVNHLEMATKVGADHVLGKPFKARELRACVGELLDGNTLNTSDS